MSFVHAACESKEMNELNSLAVKVKTSYEIIKKEVVVDETFNPPDGLTEEEMENYVPTENYFKIYISNVTEDLYVVVTNKNTDEEKTYTYSDAVNGTISFEVKESIEIVNYTIAVYSSDKTGCPNKKLHTLRITTPMYNNFSESKLCKGIEEFYLCHEYLTVKTSFEGFDILTEQYRAGQLNEDGTKKPEEKKEEGFFGFIKEHKGTVIITSVVVIALGGLATVIIVKKQRSRIV